MGIKGSICFRAEVPLVIEILLLEFKQKMTTSLLSTGKLLIYLENLGEELPLKTNRKPFSYELTEAKIIPAN